MKKRSVVIRGHSTSFSLEDEFWQEFKNIAKSRSVSLAQLTTQIDIRRKEGENLSSALRVFVLSTLKSGNSKQQEQ